MINIERVKLVLCALSSMENAELEAFAPIISNAVFVTSTLIDEAHHSDERAEYLAAAKANYNICLASKCDDVTSFSAGDVSISQSGTGLSSAKAILDEATNNVAGIINDNGFAFLGV